LHDATLSEEGQDDFAKGGSGAGVAGIEFNRFEPGALKDTVGESCLSDARGSEKEDRGLFSVL